MQKRTFFGIDRHTGGNMGYFDDFQLLNVTDVRMYGSSDVRMIHTSCHYIGIIRGSYIIEGNTENRPMVYLTPANIDTLGGWFSPAGCPIGITQSGFTVEGSPRASPIDVHLSASGYAAVHTAPRPSASAARRMF